MQKFFKSLLVLSAVCVCLAKIRPADPFDAVDDAKKLNKAILSENEKAITDILTHRSGDQRVAIAEAYKATLKRDVIEDMKSELSGDFKDLMVVMMTPLDVYYANEMFEDVKPLKKSTKFTVDVLTTSSNAFLKKVQKSFDEVKWNKKFDMATTLSIYYQGLTGRMIDGILDGKRSENQEIDVEAARADAKVIHQIGEKKTGFLRTFNDDRTVENILITRSPQQLRQITTEYVNLFGHGMDRAFRNRGYNSDLERAALNMIAVTTSGPDYFAARLHEAMAGAGTNDRVLIRTIVSHSETDLDEIRDAFQKKYGESLAIAVEDDTTGEYRRALLEIVKS